MSGTETVHATTLSGSWLAARMGVDPARIDAMRRDGELIAIRDQGDATWRYPAWQFEDGKPRPAVPRIVAAAHERGIDEARLYDLLTTPLGLRDGGRRLVDVLIEGRDDEVVAAIRGA